MPPETSHLIHLLSTPLRRHSRVAGTPTTIDVTDPDPNNGTFNEPFDDIEDCDRVVSPGDTCIIKDTSASYSGTALNASGTSGNPITYQCAGSNPDITSQISANASHIWILGCAFNTVSGVRTIRANSGDIYGWRIAGNTFQTA